MQHVESQQWMSQVVEHSQEPHEIELLAAGCQLVHGPFPELNVILQSVFARGPTRLREIVRVDIDTRHLRAAARQLEAIEPGIAADIEHAPARQVGGDIGLDLPPLDGRKIAQGMLGRRLRPIGKVQIVEPRRESGDLSRPVRLSCLTSHIVAARVSKLVASRHSPARRAALAPARSLT